ncbi:MAG: Ig-like domain-containing protein [Actinomycetes bacterium]
MTLSLTMSLGLVAVQTGVASAAVGDVTVYQDHKYASGAGAASADKPQSKLWYNDGSWWAAMATTKTVNVFRLVDHKWVDTGTVLDSRIASTADALWVRETNKLYVASRADSGTGAIQIFRYSYDKATAKYTRDAGFPVKMAGGGSESVTIARDSLQRLWITFTRGSKVWVAHSTTSDTTWTTAFAIKNADVDVAADDISAVISMGDKIGVMWSDQASSAFRFAIHKDTDADSVWSVETPLDGVRMADDHINLKSAVGADGRVFAAIKTSLGDGGEPKSSACTMVLSRSTTGVWTSAVASTLKENFTRPQLAVDTTNNLLFILQSRESGGNAYFKSTPLNKISFPTGNGSTLMSWTGAKINDVSTTKQSVDASTGLVAIGSDKVAYRYYHSEMSLGSAAPVDTTPPTVTTTSPAASATNVDASAPIQVAFSEPMQETTVKTAITVTGPKGAVSTTFSYDSVSNTATLKPSAALAAGAVYTVKVEGAKDTAGNAMAAPQSWTFTTAGAPAVGETVTVPVIADSYVNKSTPKVNYGTAQLLNVDASPVTTSYLKYDLSAYAGRTVKSATLKVAVTGGSVGTQNIKLVSDDAWDEKKLTYSNRPALGNVVGTLGPTTANSNHQVTLNAAAVQGELGGLLSLGLDSTSTDGLDFGARESSAPTQLVLVFG